MSKVLVAYLFEDWDARGHTFSVVPQRRTVSCETSRAANVDEAWARGLRTVDARRSGEHETLECHMTDLLLNAARSLGVPTDISAGPGRGLPGLSIWARWPRPPHEVAQDVLNQLTQEEIHATVSPLGGTPLWRARLGDWTHIGRFEEAVAQLALHVAEQPRAVRGRAGN
jgi:hypothetical protein